MWVSQRVGPFKANAVINFPDFNEDSFVLSYGKKYVRVGIQAPQSPWISEVWDPSDEKSEFVQQMNRFQIDTGNDKSFAINANEILEFCDLSSVEYFKVKPLQDMDAYTIVEIQLMEEEEVSS